MTSSDSQNVDMRTLDGLVRSWRRLRNGGGPDAEWDKIRYWLDELSEGYELPELAASDDFGGF